jgi:serine/threonine protein kinase
MMKVETPLVESLADLAGLWRHSEPTADGQFKFRQSTFLFITKDYKAYFGRSLNERLTPAIINGSLKRVADDVYPEAPSHITRLTESESSYYYLKRPSMAFYDSLGSKQLAKVLLEEAEVLEQIMRKPHPNIVRYHGCQIYQNRIIALALDRHPWTLQSFDCDLDQDQKKSGFDGISSAVRHLHSLGLAHNDITTSNIVISENKMWILIDFGSCKPFGDKLVMAGNSEWTISSKANDEAALRALWQWLFGDIEYIEEENNPP